MMVMNVLVKTVTWLYDSLLKGVTIQRTTFYVLSITQFLQGLVRNIMDEINQIPREKMLAFLSDSLEDVNDYSMVLVKAMLAVLLCKMERRTLDLNEALGMHRIRRVHAQNHDLAAMQNQGKHNHFKELWYFELGIAIM